MVFCDAWRKGEGVDDLGDHGSGMNRKGDEFPLNILTIEDEILLYILFLQLSCFTPFRSFCFLFMREREMGVLFRKRRMVSWLENISCCS